MISKYSSTALCLAGLLALGTAAPAQLWVSDADRASLSGFGSGATAVGGASMEERDTALRNLHETPYLQFELNISAVPTTVSGGNVSWSPPPIKGNQYREGTTVQLTAVPAASYILRAWSGNASGNANPVSVVMDGHKSVRAAFAFPLAAGRDAFEPNDTFQDAQPIAITVPGTTNISNLVMEASGSDWYEINVPALTHMSIDVIYNPAQGALSADLWDRRGVENPLAFGLPQAQDYTGTGNTRLVYVNSTAPSRLYLRVFGAQNPAYSIMIDTIVADDQYDRNGVDNNSPCPPSIIPTLAVNTLHTNLVLRDDDWYRFLLPPGTTEIDVRVDHRFFSGDLNFMVIGDDPSDCASAFGRIFAGGFSTEPIDNEVVRNINVAGRSSVLIRVYGANLFMRNLYDLQVTTR